MTSKEMLLEEINNAPEKFIEEVLDFLNFLKIKKKKESNDTMLLSESTLKKDWLKPEEDAAWQDL